MKPLLIIVLFLSSFFSIIALSSCSMGVVGPTGASYTNPEWAPTYSAGVRYYYLPDIEMYYDLSNQDYVYLDNGQWLFSNSLPAMYSNYDLYNGFSISLNNSVYQPWMHHQYYVSNYPRYYYRNKYRDEDFDHLRGFNENDRKPIYRRPEDSNKTYSPRKNDRPSEPVKVNIPSHIDRPSEPVRENEPHKVEQPKYVPRMDAPPHIDRPSTPPVYSRPSQKTNYYGKNIGQPVRVSPQMRENRTASPSRPNTSGNRNGKH